ncbi:NAD(P)H-hydrate dehydratase, partial [Mesotoga sp. UBA6090]
VPSLLLMEEAARSVFEEIQRYRVSRAVVLCGGGNNGADGYVVARLLLGDGIDVAVVRCYTPASDDCKRNAAIYSSLGGPAVDLEETSAVEDLLKRADIIIDAVFGTGFHGSLEGSIAKLFEFVNGLKAYRLAVDIPSGVSGFDGSVSDSSFKADKTVTFGLAKVGHFLYPGCEFCGEILVESAGFSKKIMNSLANSEVIDEEVISALLPERPRNSYKGSYGSVLVTGGSEVYTGAPYLSALGAFRSGCGMVYSYTPGGSASVIRNNLPEAIALVSDGDFLGPNDIKHLSKLMDRIDCVVVGPGIGRKEDSVEFVLQLLRSFPDKSFVVDADGLFAISKDLSVLSRSMKILITPHPGEFGRLNEGRTDLESFMGFCSSRGTRAILKGAASVFCNASGKISINTAGNTGLAKAGSGDLLSGSIAGFAAQTGDLDQSAILGMYFMGKAAELSRISESSNSASRIADSFSLVFKQFEQNAKEKLHGTKP